MEKRYYYKTTQGSLLNLKSPIDNPDYIEITEQEFNELSKPKEPTAEQKALQEKRTRLAELYKLLDKLDYIGTKIATGRATREEYATEIALMDEYAAEVNQLEEELGIEK